MRFTPTRVGTTAPAPARRYAPAVHPHACGDNIQHVNGNQSGSGSPPRVWGQLCAEFNTSGSQRFTPTRVGTTWPVFRWGSNGSVHPHACGDNTTMLSAIHPNTGSPPRVWGQHRSVPALFAVERFTPTRVGTTRSGTPSRCYPAVHPHACGDNTFSNIEQQSLDGSPPRVWGQPTRACQTPTSCRFTPTRVGTTSALPNASPVSAVHPHACGDNTSNTRSSAMALGSPPRVWGQRR